MEKIGSSQKGSKIHQLKGKARFNPTFTPKNNQSVQHSFISQSPPQAYVRKTVPLTRPIVIRYIDPRLVPLFHELGSLSSKCQQIVAEQQPVSPTKRQRNLELLVQSTKKLTEKVNEIIVQSAEKDEHYPGAFYKKTELVDSEFIAQKIDNRAQEPTHKNGIEKTQQKLQQLQSQNKQLHHSLLIQQQKNGRLQQQNKALKLQLTKVRDQKEQLLNSIKMELSQLQDKKQIFSQSIQRLSVIYQQK